MKNTDTNTAFGKLLNTLETNVLKSSPWNKVFKWGLKTSVASFAAYQRSKGIDAFFAALRVVASCLITLVTNPITISIAAVYSVKLVKNIDKTKPLFGLTHEDFASLAEFVGSDNLKRLLGANIITGSISTIARVAGVEEEQLEILAELFQAANLDNSLKLMTDILGFFSDEANFKHLEELLRINNKATLTPEEEKEKTYLLSYFTRQSPELLTIINKYISGKGNLGNLIGTILQSGLSKDLGTKEKAAQVAQIKFFVKALNGFRINFLLENLTPDIAAFAADKLGTILPLLPLLGKKNFSEAELEEKERKSARLEQINSAPKSQQEALAAEKSEIETFLNAEFKQGEEQTRNELIKDLLPALVPLMEKLSTDVSKNGKEQFADFVKSALDIFAPTLDSNLKTIAHKLIHDGKLTLVVGKLLPKILTFAHKNFDSLIKGDAAALTAPVSELIVAAFKDLDAQEGKDFITFLKENKTFLGEYLQKTMSTGPKDTKDYTALLDDSVFDFLLPAVISETASLSAKTFSDIITVAPLLGKRNFSEEELANKEVKSARLQEINSAPKSQQEALAAEKSEIETFLNTEFKQGEEQTRNKLIKDLLPTVSKLAEDLNSGLESDRKDMVAGMAQASINMFAPALDKNLKILIHKLIFDGKLTLVVGKLLPKILTFAHENFDSLIKGDAAALTAPVSELIVAAFKDLDAQEGKDFITFLKENKTFLGEYLQKTMSTGPKDTKDYTALLDDSVFDFLLPAVIQAFNKFDGKIQDLEGVVQYGLNIALSVQGPAREAQPGIPAEFIPAIRALLTQSLGVHGFLANLPPILEKFDAKAMEIEINTESFLDSELLSVINEFFPNYDFSVDEDWYIYSDAPDDRHNIFDLIKDGIIANGLHARLAKAAEKFGTEEGAVAAAAAIFDELSKADEFNDIIEESPSLGEDITKAIKYFALKYAGERLASMSFDVKILDLVEHLLLNTKATFHLLNALNDLSNFDMLRKSEPKYLAQRLTPLLSAFQDLFSNPNMSAAFNQDRRNAIKQFIEGSPALRMTINDFVSSFNLTLDDVFNLISNPTELGNVIATLDKIKDLDSFIDTRLLSRAKSIVGEASELSVFWKVVRGLTVGPDIRTSALTTPLSQIFAQSLKEAQRDKKTVRDVAIAKTTEESDAVKEAVIYSDYSYSTFDDFISIANMKFDDVYLSYSKFDSLYINHSQLNNVRLGSIACKDDFVIKNSELRYVYLAGIKAPLEQIKIENSLFDSSSFNNLLDSVKGLNIDQRRYVNPSRYIPTFLGGYSAEVRKLRIKDLSLEFNASINKKHPVSFPDFMAKYYSSIDPSTNIKLIRFKDLNFADIDLSMLESIEIKEISLENCAISESKFNALKQFCEDKSVKYSIAHSFDGVAFNKINFDKLKNAQHITFENANFSEAEQATIEAFAKDNGITLEITKAPVVEPKKEEEIEAEAAVETNTIKEPVVAPETKVEELAVIAETKLEQLSQQAERPKSHAARLEKPKAKTNANFMLDGLKEEVLARALDRVPLNQRSPEMIRQVTDIISKTLEDDFTYWSKTDHYTKIEVGFSAHFQGKISEKQKTAQDYITQVLDNICTQYSNLVPKILQNSEFKAPINTLDVAISAAFDTIGKKSVLWQIQDPCQQKGV